MGMNTQQLPELEVGVDGVGLGGRSRGQHAADEEQRVTG